MIRLLPMAAAFVVLAGCANAHSVPGMINGKWSGPDGEIGIDPCPSSTNLCVTVVSGNGAAPEMAAIVGKVVVRDMALKRPGVWAGRYVGEGKNLPATIRLKDIDHGEFRVCLLSWLPFGLCEVQQYTRIKP